MPQWTPPPYAVKSKKIDELEPAVKEPIAEEPVVDESPIEEQKLPPVADIKGYIAQITDPNKRKISEGLFNKNKIWSPPPYAEGKGTEQKPKEPGIGEKIWNSINTPVLNLRETSPFIKKATEEYQRENPVLGGIGNTLIDTISASSSPLSLGLGATAGAAGLARNAAIKAAMSEGGFANSIRLARIAKALETPSRVAAYGMMGHGGYRVLEGETLPEKLSGGLEAGLGFMGRRSGIGKFPTEVPPVEEGLKFPLPRGNNPPTNYESPFVGGEAGIAENRPYKIDMGQPLPNDMMSGSGTVLDGEIVPINEIPPDLAARRGINFGEPSRDIPTADIPKQLPANTQTRFMLPDEFPPQEASPELPVKQPFDANAVLDKIKQSIQAAGISAPSVNPNEPQFSRVGKNEIGPARPLDMRSFEDRFVDSGKPEQPTAKFSSFDANGKPTFHITGGEFDKSDVGLDKLKELGLEIPEVPKQVSQIPPFIKSILDNAGVDTSGMSVTDAVNRARELKGMQSTASPAPPAPSAFTPKSTDVLDESGRSIAPQQAVTPERPMGPWNSNTAQKIGQTERSINTSRFSKEWKPPDYAVPSDEEPQFARSEQGGIKIGANIERQADEVTTAYSGALEGIMVREGLQNAIDAVRHLGPEGHIKINAANDGITITDNGKGMNRQELETVFSNLNETGKVGEENATGGKGVGKASYMLGGQHFIVETVKLGTNGKKTRITAAGTREDFLKHVPLNETEVPKETPTGTTIRVQFKPGQKGYEARGMLNKVLEHTRGLETKITDSSYGAPIAKFLEKGTNDTIIGKRTFTDGGTNDVVIRIPKGAPENRSYIRVNYLNNGMYQFSDNHHLSVAVANMPAELVVDIHPHAKEGTTEYPFPTSRESIKDKLKEDITRYIDQVLVEPEKEKRKNVLSELYNSMAEFPNANTIRKPVMFDPGDRLTSEELQKFQDSPVINKLISTLDETVNSVLNKLDDPKLIDRLEGVGLVLDREMFGVHIPNPQSGKSTLLVNILEHVANSDTPEDAAFDSVVTALHEIAHIGVEGKPPMGGMGDVSVEELDDPRIGKYLESYLKQVIAHGGINSGHGFSFLQRLGDIYAQYGAGRTFSASDKIQSILSGPDGGYSPEIQELLSIYKESRGRPETTKDFLSGTGEKQANKRRSGKGNIPDADNPNGKGTAVDRLKEALVLGKTARMTQDKLYGAERSRRAGLIDSVKSGGTEGYFKQLGMLHGPLPKVEMKPLLSKSDTDELMDTIKNSDLLPYQRMNAQTGLFKLLTGHAPQDQEINLIAKVFGKDLGETIMLHGGLGISKLPQNFFADAATLAKTAKSGLDLSASLRQGLPFIDRKAYWESFVNMHKYFGAKKNFEIGMEAIKSHPDYQLLEDSGLFLAELSDDPTKREEGIMSSWLNNVPMFAGSQRAYTGFLNDVRFKVALSLMEDMKRAGIKVSKIGEDGERVPTRDLAEVTNWINITSGRGNLGKYGERIAVPLNVALWSPRNISSKLTMMNPAYYIESSPFVRKQHLRSLLAIAGAGLSTLALMKLIGASVSLDPTSADFGKARLGNTRLDPWIGLQQNVVASNRILTYIRNAAALLQGKSMDMSSKYRPGTGYNTQTAKDVAGDWLENKASPIGSFILNLANMGKEPEPGGMAPVVAQGKVTQQIINLYSPMLLDDLTDLAKEDRSLFPNVVLGALGLYGQSLNTYSSRPRSPFRNVIRAPGAGIPVSPNNATDANVIPNPNSTYNRIRQIFGTSPSTQ